MGLQFGGLWLRVRQMVQGRTPAGVSKRCGSIRCTNLGRILSLVTCGNLTQRPNVQRPNARSLFEAQPCTTELAAAVQRPDLCDDFLGVGESLPSEAADPPALRFE